MPKKFFAVFIVVLLALMSWGAASASIASWETPVRPDVLRVDLGGSARFTSIGDAIRAAKPYDIIRVGPGVYSEPLNVNKPLTIIGAGLDTVYTATVYVSANDVEMKDDTFMSIYDNRTSFDWNFGGIVTMPPNYTPSDSYVTGLKVTNCSFIDCRQGVFLFGCKDSLVENCVFRDCYRGVTINRHFLDASFSWTASGNTIRNCRFVNMKGTGDVDGEAVAIHNASKNVVEDCTMLRCSYGVLVTNGAENVVRNCTIKDSTYKPVVVTDAGGTTTVTRCTITNNTQNVFFRDSTVSFTNNVLRDNGRTMLFQRSSGFTCDYNTIKGSTVRMDGCDSGTMGDNKFELSGHQAIDVTGTSKTHYALNIAGTNTINGQPLIYYYDKVSPSVDDRTVGAIMFAYCSSPTVSGCSLGTADGIWLHSSPDFLINADIVNCLYGINATDSPGGEIDDCTINTSTRGWYGVRMASSDGGATRNSTVENPNGAPAFRLEGGTSHDTYGSTFGYNSVEATLNGGGDLLVHNDLRVKVWDNGMSDPFPGAHLEITEDDVPVYQSSHFGGGDATSDASGMLGPIALLDRGYYGSNVPTEHTHDVNVWAQVDAEWSDQATDVNMANSRLLQFEASDIRRPATPNNLVVTDVPEEDAVQVTWNANTDDTLVYSLYWYRGSGWNLLENLSVPTTTYRIGEGLAHGDQLEFAVSAWDEVPFESIRSDAVGVTHADGKAPAAPSGLRETEVTGDLINLTWDAVQEVDVEAYHVYVNASGGGATGPWTKLTPGSGRRATTFSVQGLMSETTYHFVVTALDEVPNESPRSVSLTVTTLDITPPAAPVLDDAVVITNQATYTALGTAEAGSTVTVFVGATEAGTGQADEDGDFSIEVTLREGGNLLTAWATDPSDNTGPLSAELAVVLDLTPPVANAGPDIEQKEETEVSFDGSGSTDDRGIREHEWTFTLDDIEVTLEGAATTYTFEDPVTLTVTLTVTDLAGNVDEDTLEVVIVPKNVPPILRDGAMTPDKGTTRTKFKFTVVFYDEDGDIGEVWLYVDGEAFIMAPDPADTVLSDGKTYVYETKMKAGEHTYYFTGRDSFGHDAGGPSAGESNAKSTPDIERKEVDSPGMGLALVLLSLLGAALILNWDRRRR